MQISHASCHFYAVNQLILKRIHFTLHAAQFISFFCVTCLLARWWLPVADVRERSVSLEHEANLVQEKYFLCHITNASPRAKNEGEIIIVVMEGEELVHSEWFEEKQQQQPKLSKNYGCNLNETTPSKFEFKLFRYMRLADSFLLLNCSWSPGLGAGLEDTKWFNNRNDR